MTAEVQVAFITGVFACLAVLIQSKRKDTRAHGDMSTQLDRIEKDLGGMRSDHRATNARVDHIARRLDNHLDKEGTTT